MGGTYLPMSGWGGVPTLAGVGGYLLSGRGVPTLAGVGGTYSQVWVGGVPTFPCLGGGVPTLARVGTPPPG